MTTPVFTGSGVALLTAFDRDGALATGATAALAENLFAEGITAFLVAGTAGEFFLLDDAERVALVRAVRNALPAAATVLAHVGGVPGDRAAAITAATVDVGADAIVALPLGIDALPAYYDEIVTAAADTPVMAYHLPQLGASIPLSRFAQLGVRALKDSDGDVARLRDEVQAGIEVYTGAPNTLAAMHGLGGPGTLVGLANSHPQLTIAAFAGDLDAQRELDALEPASLDDFPTRLKVMTAERCSFPTTSRGKALA